MAWILRTSHCPRLRHIIHILHFEICASTHPSLLFLLRPMTCILCLLATARNIFVGPFSSISGWMEDAGIADGADGRVALHTSISKSNTKKPRCCMWSSLPYCICYNVDRVLWDMPHLSSCNDVHRQIYPLLLVLIFLRFSAWILINLRSFTSLLTHVKTLPHSHLVQLRWYLSLESWFQSTDQI